MENIITIIIAGIVGIIIGFIITKIIERSNSSQLIKSAKKRAVSIAKQAAKDAETLKKDKILQAKEKFIELKSEHEKVIIQRDKKISEAEKRIRDKESQVSNELTKSKKLNIEVEEKKKDYEDRMKYLKKKQTEVDKLHRRQVEQLEVISSLSEEDAKGPPSGRRRSPNQAA